MKNCVLGRFQQAIYSETKDRYTILVDKHKTTRHHDPAELTTTSHIYSYLQIYVVHARPNYSEDALFIKNDGHSFRPGTIGRFFEQAGLRCDVKVSATSIRKMISNKAYKLSPTKKRLIYGHMKHSERTDVNYVIRLNAEHASHAHQLMQTIIDESTPGATKWKMCPPIQNVGRTNSSSLQTTLTMTTSH